MKQTPIFPPSPLERAREGMTVVDETGRQLGTVARIQLGDPQAVTTSDEDTYPREPAVIAAPAGATGGTTAFGAAMPLVGNGVEDLNLPDQLRRELVRTGFVELDGPELAGAERYVSGDRILDVSGDTLRVRKSIPPASSGSRLERIRSAAVEPVLRAPHARPPAMPRPLLLVAACVAALAAVGGIGLIYRRRQAERQPVARVRRAARAVRGSTRSIGFGAAILVALTLLRGLTGRRSAQSKPADASATVTVSLPRWRRRA